MKENVIIAKNAKKEEVKAYYILKDTLFNNAEVFIGDNIEKGLPDIYTSDHVIGVEVTSCEHLAQFLAENDYEKQKLNNGRQNRTKKIIEEYSALSLKDKNLLFISEFKKLLEKKIKRIPAYKSVKNISLIIMSDNINKEFIRRDTLSNLYRELVEEYKVKFDNLFLYYNNTLYADVNYTFLKMKKVKTKGGKNGNKEYCF